MKLWHILTGITLTAALTGTAMADQISGAPLPASGAGITSAVPQGGMAMPAISGTVTLHQRIALPPKAALTVTVSDATVPDAPSRVVAQQVAWTDGMQAPFTFTLPYNPADIQPNARILLSAAITLDNRVVMVTQNIEPVITNGVTQANLTLIPVESVALPAQGQSNMLSPSSAPTPTTNLMSPPDSAHGQQSGNNAAW